MKQILFLALFFFPLLTFSKGLVIGDPKATKGGSFSMALPAYPKDLLFYLALDEFSEMINNQVIEMLAESHLESGDLVPRLAKEWTVSKDKKTFTFKLDPKAKFSDGTPVTSADVVFTWDTIMSPKNKTVPFQSTFASIETCKAIDPQTVQFQAKVVHFKNLEKLASIYVLPRHFFSKGDFNKDFNMKLLGSGPYTVEEVKPGERITLKRDPNYWGSVLPQNTGRYNFDKLVFKVIPEPEVAHEAFKKGDLDYHYFFLAKMWATETDGGPYKDGKITKIKAENLQPYATQGIAWNLRNPIFADKNVRLALSHLFNRERLIKELFYNNYVPGTGVIHRKSVYHSPKNNPIPYDPKKALSLLKSAGWTDIDNEGVLLKEGKRFEFELLTKNPSSHRYLTIYQEDLKKVGIKMTIRTLDWGTALKLIEEWKFDATDMARSRDTDPADFGTSWGSAEADKKGSGNFVGYKNPKVDALAEKIDLTFEKKKRIPIVQEIDHILSEDQPFTFGWEANFYRIAHWNKFSYPGRGYFNYSKWTDSFDYWYTKK